MVIKRWLEVPPLQIFALESPLSLLASLIPAGTVARFLVTSLKCRSCKFRKWHHFTFRYSDVIRLSLWKTRERQHLCRIVMYRYPKSDNFSIRSNHCILVRVESNVAWSEQKVYGVFKCSLLVERQAVWGNTRGYKWNDAFWEMNVWQCIVRHYPLHIVQPWLTIFSLFDCQFLHTYIYFAISKSLYLLTSLTVIFSYYRSSNVVLLF